MIDAVVKVADRLVMLFQLRAKRRATIFDQVLKPVFADLQAVHADYIKLFADFEAACEGAHLDSVRAGASKLAAARLTFQPQRQRIRVTVDALRDSGFPEEEQRFVHSVADYFRPASWSANDTHSSIAVALAFHIIGRADTLLTVETVAPDKSDPVQLLRSAIQSIRRDLMNEWGSVCFAYAKLELAVASL